MLYVDDITNGATVNYIAYFSCVRRVSENVTHGQHHAILFARINDLFTIFQCHLWDLLHLKLIYNRVFVGVEYHTWAKRFSTVNLITVVSYIILSMGITLFFYHSIGLRHIPANSRRSPKVGLMLGQRRRRWTNIEPTLGERLVFAGISPDNPFRPTSIYFILPDCFQINNSQPLVFQSKYDNLSLRTLTLGPVTEIRVK